VTIADLKPYAEYKESGVPWLGKVPRHWETRKLKHVTHFVNGFPFKPGDWKASGIPIIRIQNLNGATHFNYTDRRDLPEEALIRPGDLMFAWSGNRGTSFGPFQWNRSFSAYLNQHIFKLKGHTLPNRYFYYVLRAATRHVEEQAGGIIGLVHVTKPELGSVRVSVAPREDQTAMVRFLDGTNGRLERAIRAKRKVIALLNEQKQAIIHHAVTRGLDSSIPVKPSGIPWLGDIPQHWKVEKTKNVFRLRTQKSGLAHGKELLSIYTHIGVRPRRDLEQKGNKASTTDNYWTVEKGDLIVNKLLAWMGAVGSSNYEGVTSPAYDVLMPIRPLSSDYYHHLFRTKLYLSLFKQRSRGIMDMRLRLYFDQLGQIAVPFPPVDEQAAIVAFHVEATADLTAAISRLEREIGLLREYRTRLIADVVTGKLDVREAATRLPEEATADTPDEDADPSDEIEPADEEAVV
jgi:type I restriction enzyme, S subunit